MLLGQKRCQWNSALFDVLIVFVTLCCFLQSPEQFRFVVEQTLREFYKALVAGKDSEQSWKKSIYKVIARMDDSVPDYFKSPNFLDTLEWRWWNLWTPVPSSLLWNQPSSFSETPGLSRYHHSLPYQVDQRLRLFWFLGNQAKYSEIATMTFKIPPEMQSSVVLILGKTSQAVPKPLATNSWWMLVDRSSWLQLRFGFGHSSAQVWPRLLKIPFWFWLVWSRLLNMQFQFWLVLAEMNYFFSRLGSGLDTRWQTMNMRIRIKKTTIQPPWGVE